MPSAGRVTYADIQAYLDAIADKAVNDVAFSSHDRFWRVPYKQFITGTVPGEKCGGLPIPIVNSSPASCPLYEALTSPTGWCKLGRMPLGGPFITDPGYSVTLKDGTTISGSQIDADIVWWLTNKMPEN
jgi:hypothetical protein